MLQLTVSDEDPITLTEDNHCTFVASKENTSSFEVARHEFIFSSPDCMSFLTALTDVFEGNASQGQEGSISIWGGATGQENRVKVAEFCSAPCSADAVVTPTSSTTSATTQADATPDSADDVKKCKYLLATCTVLILL